MPQPPKYEREWDFAQDEGDRTNHVKLNAELDDAALSINCIRASLALIQRDDGTLRGSPGDGEEGGGVPPAGSVGTDQLADEAVTTAKLAPKAVTKEKLAPEAVAEDKIAPKAVTEDKLAPKAVTADKIAPKAVTADKLSGPLRAPAFSVSGSESIAAGNGDGVGPTVNNLALRSWQGIGFGPSIDDGYPVPSNAYSHWFNTRTGDAGMRGQLTVQGARVRLPSANGNGSVRTLHHNDDTIGFTGNHRGWIYRVLDNGDIWTPMFGWLTEFLAGKANAGRECPHNRGVWEFGGINSGSPGPVDLLTPWIVTGIRGGYLTEDRLWAVYIRASTLRNQ